MYKVGIVAGTRPEVIKMAPLFLELKKSEKISPQFIATAQHRQMLDQELAIFGIKPDYDMDIMQPGQTLSDLTARIICAWDKLLSRETFDAVLVQGDTTTVLASALSAFYHHIKIGHVEAGLRTFDMQSPFPEEMNRRLTSPLATWSFAPTRRAYDNLISERIDPRSCHITGNTVVDALLHTVKKVGNFEEVAQSCGISAEFSKKYGSGKYILVTGHRRENFGGGFENICTAIRTLIQRHSEIGIVYPVHLNPNVQKPVKEILGGLDAAALIKPVGYSDFVGLMKHCRFILSDSGGVQEEAPSLGKPVLVMRGTTERPEGVEAGTCKLVGTDVDKIIMEAEKLLSDDCEYIKRSALANPYGDGSASLKIRKILEESL